MSERWAAVLDGNGDIISIGTVVADDLEARGLTVEWVDIADGEVPAVVDGKLVGVAPAEPTPAPSLEELVAAKVAEELDRRQVGTVDSARSAR